MPEITPFDARPTEIDGLVVLTMKQVAEERGVVREFYRASAFDDASLSLGPWRQVNVTFTRRGALRGMHAEEMVKLVAVVAGEAFAAYVDLRPGSDTHGKVVTITLRPGTQVLVPKGVGNGFQAVSEDGCQYLYCFDAEWVPGMSGLACTPLDPALGISWPLPIDPDDPSQLSVKDRDAPLFSELGRSGS
ncbi:MAG: dTDP-4-dehydrorhamnose 3,5-epimerase family protein [Acidimicrobiales bacterium]